MPGPCSKDSDADVAFRRCPKGLSRGAAQLAVAADGLRPPLNRCYVRVHGSRGPTGRRGEQHGVDLGPVGHSPKYAVGWFTLASINAGLGQSKNGSGGLWLLGSLFLGPVATLIIVALEKTPA